MHWDPPSDNEGVSFCSIEYKDKPKIASEGHVPSIIIPVANNQHQYVISGLNRETDYLIKLYCFYGNSRGPSTGWIRAATRTGDVILNWFRCNHTHLYTFGIENQST